MRGFKKGKCAVAIWPYFLTENVDCTRRKDRQIVLDGLKPLYYDWVSAPNNVSAHLRLLFRGWLGLSINTTVILVSQLLHQTKGVDQQTALSKSERHKVRVPSRCSGIW